MKKEKWPEVIGTGKSEIIDGVLHCTINFEGISQNQINKIVTFLENEGIYIKDE